MEFVPRHKHPFTWDELMELDVVEITQELSRLQDSVQRLQNTQKELHEYLTTDPDPDIRNAVDENVVVIESQSERIKMLRFALQARGLARADNPHYDTAPTSAAPPSTVTNGITTSRGSVQTASAPAGYQETSVDDGVYL